MNGRATVASLLLFGLALLSAILLGGGFMIWEAVQTIAGNTHQNGGALFGGVSIVVVLTAGLIGLKVAGIIIILALACEPSPILQAIVSAATLGCLFLLDLFQSSWWFGAAWGMTDLIPEVALTGAKVLIGLTWLTSAVQLATRQLKNRQ